MFYGYGRHTCSQHHSLQCDGWWPRKAIRIPPAAGTTVMETCKPGSWSLLAGTHAINFHADVGKKHFTLLGILSGWFVVVNKDSDYHMATRASVSFTCFWSPIWRRGTLTWAWPVRIHPSAGFLMTEMLAVKSVSFTFSHQISVNKNSLFLAIMSDVHIVDVTYRASGIWLRR